MVCVSISISSMLEHGVKWRKEKFAHSLSLSPKTKIGESCVWSTFSEMLFTNLPDIKEIFLHADSNFTPISACDRSQ